MNDHYYTWILKTAGALSGSFISLAWFLPESRREAVWRLGVGVFTGLFLGPMVGHKLRDFGLQGTDSEMLLGGCFVASTTAWWGWGFVKRSLETSGYMNTIKKKMNEKRDDD